MEPPLVKKRQTVPSCKDGAPPLVTPDRRDPKRAQRGFRAVGRDLPTVNLDASYGERAQDSLASIHAWCEWVPRACAASRTDLGCRGWSSRRHSSHSARAAPFSQFDQSRGDGGACDLLLFRPREGVMPNKPNPQGQPGNPKDRKSVV